MPRFYRSLQWTNWYFVFCILLFSNLLWKRKGGEEYRYSVSVVRTFITYWSTYGPFKMHEFAINESAITLIKKEYFGFFSMSHWPCISLSEWPMLSHVGSDVKDCSHEQDRACADYSIAIEERKWSSPSQRLEVLAVLCNYLMFW